VAPPNFEQSYKKHLGPAQRREILDTLRATLKRDTTLGEIVDAAAELGWGEAMGDLRLSDLAESLLAGASDDVELHTADDEGGDEGEAHEGERLAAPRTPKKKAAKKATAKKAAAKQAAAKTATRAKKAARTAAGPPAPASPKKPAKAAARASSKKPAKKAAKKASARRR
jgi:hypothetical protein